MEFDPPALRSKHNVTRWPIPESQMLSTISETTTWRPVTYGGETYELSHLNSKTINYIVPPERADAPARNYVVDVIYSPHCFTCGLPRKGPHDKLLEYRDGRDVRLFNVERWKLSHLLPGIIENLMYRACKFGNGYMQNYLTVEVVTAEGQNEEYSVFFTVTKSSIKGRLNLFVQSAYIGANLPNSRNVRFRVILAKAAEGKKPHG